MISYNYLIATICCGILVSVQCASIEKNLVYESPRINSGEQLVSNVINDCFSGETVSCLKGKVLNYLDTQLNINEEYGRSFDAKNIDEVIYDRAGRVLATKEFRMELPETFFNRAIVSYRADQGLDIELNKEEGMLYNIQFNLIYSITYIVFIFFFQLVVIY